MQQNETLSPKQDKAIVALLSTPTVDGAAEIAGVNRSTVHRWLNEDEFRAELTRRRNEIADAALDAFKCYVFAAVEALAKLLESSDNEKVRRLAAKDVLDYVLKIRHAQEIEARLRKLEGERQEGLRVFPNR